MSYKLTTIADLAREIESLLGSEAKSDICSRMALQIWGGYYAGDEIEMPQDLAQRHIELEQIQDGNIDDYSDSDAQKIADGERRYRQEVLGDDS